MTKRANLLSSIRMLSVLAWLAGGALACSSDDADDGSAGTRAGGTGGTDGDADASTSDGGNAGTGGSNADASTSGGAFTLTSEAFADGDVLPDDHRCVALGGETGPSPQLAWSGAPDDTQSFAITVTDKSTGIGAGYAHWTLFDIPASTTELAAGVVRAAMPSEPAGAKQCANQNAFVPGPGYFGPCGQTQNPYEFRVYALDIAELADVTADSSAADVRAAIDAHTIESAAVTALSGP